jgi:hypothetical protein
MTGALKEKVKGKVKWPETQLTLQHTDMTVKKKLKNISTVTRWEQRTLVPEVPQSCTLKIKLIKYRKPLVITKNNSHNTHGECSFLADKGVNQIGIHNI